MRMVRSAAALIAAVVLVSAAAAQPERKLSVLIVTGQNNHDWRATTPVLKELLERSGRFEVTVNEHPAAATVADFAPYDVIMSNYNGPRWGAAAEQALLDFVRGGKGFVVIHAANNAFTDWPEYIALIGGYWGETAGHGRQHQFLVRMVDHSHPITRGMSDFVHATDELYHRLTMQPDIHLLATAFSAPEQGGTGRDEPIAWTVDFGAGRCFHCVLGHHVEAMQGTGFAALVQRGTEWAATGDVSAATEVRTLLPQLGAEDEAVRYAAKARLIEVGAAAVPALLEAVGGADARVGAAARDALLWIAPRWAGTAQRNAIQETLVQFSQAGQPSEVRALAARMLGLVGDARAAPALEAMLSDAAVREEARRALMQIPGPEVTQVLVQMLARVEPEFQEAILDALGARKDKAATAAIIKAARSGEARVRLAAISALGRLGDPAAAEALRSLAVGGRAQLRSAAVDAYLRLADAMLAQRETGRAVSMYRQVLTMRASEMQQVAALVGLGASGRREVVNDLRAFRRDESPRVRAAADTALSQVRRAVASGETGDMR